MVVQSVYSGANVSVRPYVRPLILPRLPVRVRLLGDTSDLLLQLGGPYLAVYLWAFLLVLSVFMMVLYPVVIAPLFNTYTPVSGLDLLVGAFVQGYATSPALIEMLAHRYGK